MTDDSLPAQLRYQALAHDKQPLTADLLRADATRLDALEAQQTQQSLPAPSADLRQAQLDKIRRLAYWEVPNTTQELRTRLAMIGVAAAEAGAREPEHD